MQKCNTDANHSPICIASNHQVENKYSIAYYTNVLRYRDMGCTPIAEFDEVARFDHVHIDLIETFHKITSTV